MRVLSIFYLLFFISSSCIAQLSISNIKDFEVFKNTTTVVFMPAADTSKHHNYRKIIEKNWTLTPLKFISYSKYVDYKNKDGYSYLLFGDDHISNGTSNASYVYLELWMWADARAISNKKRRLARVDLYPDTKTTYNPSLIYDYRFDTEGHIFNWSLGLLKNYIQIISNHLVNEKFRNPIFPQTDANAIKTLHHKKLYIPDYVLKTFNGYSEEIGKQTARDLMTKYNYPYEFLSQEQLSDKILAAEQGDSFYYLLFTRTNADKFISIVDAQSGKIIYSRYRPLSYNLKPADFKRLNRVIAKASK